MRARRRIGRLCALDRNRGRGRDAGARLRPGRRTAEARPNGSPAIDRAPAFPPPAASQTIVQRRLAHARDGPAFRRTGRANGGGFSTASCWRSTRPWLAGGAIRAGAQKPQQDARRAGVQRLVARRRGAQGGRTRRRGRGGPAGMREPAFGAHRGGARRFLALSLRAARARRRDRAACGERPGARRRGRLSRDAARQPPPRCRGGAHADRPASWRPRRLARTQGCARPPAPPPASRRRCWSGWRSPTPGSWRKCPASRR